MDVTVVSESAVITGKKDGCFTVEAGGSAYAADKLLIATGSVPVTPPIPGLKEGLESGYVLTNREILDIDALPESLAVIGGGVVGLEMASYFNSAGVKVTVIEMLDKIAGPTDREISDILMKAYMKKGVEFRLSSTVTEIRNGSVTYGRNGETAVLNASKVLLSVGRKPLTEGIGLESIGVI